MQSPEKKHPKKGQSKRYTTTISISVQPGLPDLIDARVMELGLNRSEYVVKLILRDMIEDGLISEKEWFEKLAARKRKRGG
jgi:hypothetical protein